MWCLTIESLADEIILHVASQNLKTLQLVQAEVATWKRDPSCFVLYCGNICSFHYKTIIVETITLHAFIL